jgi:hypothetical protein
VSRYSQLYIDQSAPLPDSARARHRLGKLLQDLVADIPTVQLSHTLERELGIKVGAVRAYYWPTFCGACSIRDFLDTVTLTFTFLKRQGSIQTRWLVEARRIFSEERLAYEIDDNGIVHPTVDKEFQRNRQATVAGLQMQRYANSLAAFERISDELASQPPNGKEAWRAVFTSVEGLFKASNCVERYRVPPWANQLIYNAAKIPLGSAIWSHHAIAANSAGRFLALDFGEQPHRENHE